jgi:hypothetical protein
MTDSSAASGSEESAGLTLAFENLSQEGYDLVVADLREREGSSTLVQIITRLTTSLRETDLPKTRLVVTGDLVASVNSREDRTGNEYTVDRGAGVVAAKTMPPNNDGIVDILLPAHWLLQLEDAEALSTRDELLQHTAAHEAVHASIHHNGNEPFDLHLREELGYATTNFVSMASEQIEEHLAEYLGSKATGCRVDPTSGDVSSAIDAWRDTLAKKLPAIPGDDPAYIEKGIRVTFGALHVLWILLAYLAGSLRNGDGFDSVPDDIARLPGWRKYVAPWWDRYVLLLGQIPMSIDVDIAATDEVVRELADHLKLWADEMGFDFHDVDGGGGFFRIKIWD